MFYLTVYDIEENKIRRHVSRTLERYGGKRIQKSVFLLDMSEDKKNLLKDELKDILDTLENHDSILIFPMEKDQISQATRIGQNPAFEEAITYIHTLFF